jgi:DNA-binding transcriptional ArsR family regulator
LWYDLTMLDVPPVSHPLPETLVELVAQRFRVLGEPMRIKLLDQLREGHASVGELQQALGATQENVSKHLGILHRAGMVRRTKRGNSVVYAIDDRRYSSSVTRSAAAFGANSHSWTRSCNLSSGPSSTISNRISVSACPAISGYSGSVIARMRSAPLHRPGQFSTGARGSILNRR